MKLETWQLELLVIVRYLHHHQTICMSHRSISPWIHHNGCTLAGSVWEHKYNRRKYEQQHQEYIQLRSKTLIMNKYISHSFFLCHWSKEKLWSIKKPLKILNYCYIRYLWANNNHHKSWLSWCYQNGLPCCVTC